MLRRARARGMTVGEHQHRRPIQIGACDAVDDGRDAGSQCGETRTDSTGDLGLRERRDRRAGFRRGEHERQSRTTSGSDEIQVAAAARHAEEGDGAGLAQLLNDQFGDCHERKGGEDREE